MNNIIRLYKKQEKATKLLNTPAMKEKLSDHGGSLAKLIDENDEFVLSMCETYENEQDPDELADTLLRYLHKQKVQFFFLFYYFDYYYDI